jgi:hypothetical protein
MKIVGSIIAVLLLLIGVAALLWQHQRRQELATANEREALRASVESLQAEVAPEASPGKVPVEAPTAPSRAQFVEPNPPASSGKEPPNSAMLNDPETRALMRKQQEQEIAKFAEKIVSKDFVREWTLSQDEAAKVKEWVRAKQAAGKDLLTAMMFDGLDDDALAQRGRETKARLEESDAALRQLLGPEGFAALKRQEQAVEDSGRVRRFREELSTTDEPLTPAQTESLRDALAQERQNFSFRVDYGDVSKVDFENVRNYFSEANLQIHFEDLQQFNARILDRAAGFLSPAQTEQLKLAQDNQLERARITVKMTTELFNARRAN